MSRIAKYPVVIPDKVDVTVGEGELTVKGPLGTLKQRIARDVVVKRDGDKVTFAAGNETKAANALSGTMRAIVANMVHGVKTGFEKRLSLVGVGYRAQAQGNKVNLTLGFSHPIVHALPDGVKAETPTQTEIVIKGVDRQKVGQVAAEIRAYKAPEPYKGKGVRYTGEQVSLKETKKK
jgi:large subunit ribosomal protein L6